MAEDGEASSPPAEPSPVAAASEPPPSPPVDSAAEMFFGLEPAVVPPPAPVRRRFDPGPNRGDRPKTSVWQRHWYALGGLIFFALSVRALVDASWPSWHPGSTSERSLPAGPLAVIIDPGHGGDDTGAVSQGVVEKDLNLDVGRRIAQTLAARSIKVRLTREDDHFISLEERVRMGNAQPGTVFVSIHFNDASGDGRVAMNRASGIETFYSQNKAMSASAGGWMWASLFGAGAKADPAAARDVEAWSEREGESLAQSIQGALVASTAAADRGIKERSLYVTRRVRGPSVLVEGGFVSHPAEAKLLGDPSYRQKLADAIADGIVKYLDAASRQPVPSAVAAASRGA